MALEPTAGRTTEIVEPHAQARSVLAGGRERRAGEAVRADLLECLGRVAARVGECAEHHCHRGGKEERPMMSMKWIMGQSSIVTIRRMT